MGLASAIGLGIALAAPDRAVVVFDGDGNLLMSLGILPMIGGGPVMGRGRPANLVHVVFDNGLYGSMEFAQYARQAGLQAITGAELTLRDCFPGMPEPGTGHHVTLLAETPTGYANLCRLLTQAHMGSERTDPRLPFETLLELTEGLILLTGCAKSPVAAALDGSRPPRTTSSNAFAPRTSSAEHDLQRTQAVFSPHKFF